MRTTEELLIVVRDNLKTSNLHTGLCGFVDQLHSNQIITMNEMSLLDHFISDNRPGVLSKHYSFQHSLSGYYWTSGSKEPRIKWIKNVNFVNF